MKAERKLRKIFHSEAKQILENRREKIITGACPEALGAQAEKSKPTGVVRKPYYAIGIAAAVLLLFGAVAITCRFFGGNGQEDRFAGNYSESGEPVSSDSSDATEQLHESETAFTGDSAAYQPSETEGNSTEFWMTEEEPYAFREIAFFLREPFAIIEILSPAAEGDKVTRIGQWDYSKVKCKILFQTNARVEESVPSSPDSVMEIYFPVDFARSCNEYTHLFVNLKRTSTYSPYYMLMDVNHCIPIVNNRLVCASLENGWHGWEFWPRAGIIYKLKFVNKILDENPYIYTDVHFFDPTGYSAIPTPTDRFRNDMMVEEIEAFCRDCEQVYVEYETRRKQEEEYYRQMYPDVQICY